MTREKALEIHRMIRDFFGYTVYDGSYKLFHDIVDSLDYGNRVGTTIPKPTNMELGSDNSLLCDYHLVPYRDEDSYELVILIIESCFNTGKILRENQ